MLKGKIPAKRFLLTDFLDQRMAVLMGGMKELTDLALVEVVVLWHEDASVPKGARSGVKETTQRRQC